MSRGSGEATTRTRTGRVAVLLAAATVAAIDLAAKAASEVRLADSSVDLGLLQLQLAYNSGVAFSMGDRLPVSVIVAVTAAIADAGGTAMANYDSVAVYDNAGRMVGQCVETYGKIDFLVNVAGILRERMGFNMTEPEWDDGIRVHLKGTFATTHFAGTANIGEFRPGFNFNTPPLIVR